MLAHAGGHQEVAARDLREHVDHVLRHDGVVALVVGHRVGRAQRVDLCVPLAVVAGLDPRVDRLEERLHVGVDRDVGGLVLVDLRGVDVDVDDLAVLGELRELARHAVVEPHAEGQQQVGLADRDVRVDGAVHAEHAERQVMVAGDRAQALQGHGDGDLGLLDELAKLLVGVGRRDAAAAVDDRPLAPLMAAMAAWSDRLATAGRAGGSRAGPSPRRNRGWRRWCSARPWACRSARGRAGRWRRCGTPPSRRGRCPWRSARGNGAW